MRLTYEPSLESLHIFAPPRDSTVGSWPSYSLALKHPVVQDARVEERVGSSKENVAKGQLLKKFALNLRFRQKSKPRICAVLKGFTPSTTLAWCASQA